MQKHLKAHNNDEDVFAQLASSGSELIKTQVNQENTKVCQNVVVFR